MAGGSDVLALTERMEERALRPGESLYEEGTAAEVAVALLVDGQLDVVLAGATISVIDTPGAFIGEIGALLGTARSATVVARVPSTVRVIGDPDAFFAEHPELALELARQLAGRLHRLLVYLADTRAQYAGDGERVAVIDSVLGRLASRPAVDVEPGSDRSPDY